MDYDYCTSDPAWYHLLKELAKKNRQHPTDAEAVLWRCLKGSSLGLPFRQQHIIGDYIVDFICLPAKVIIEVDGGYHFVEQQQELDAQREQWLINRGYEVVRFTNAEVLCDLERVLDVIKEKIKENAKQ